MVTWTNLSGLTFWKRPNLYRSLILEVLDDLRKQRLEKLHQIQEMGIQPYAYSFVTTHKVNEILETFDPGKEAPEVTIAGRLMSLRRMGKASFAHLMDMTGRIQIYMKQDEVGEKSYSLFKLLDIGDIIGVSGQVFRTHTGEITVAVKRLELLSKTLRPLPIVKEKIQDEEKIVYDAFADKELRYRQRYVDLVVNSDVKKVFIERSKIISSMRRYLEGLGYIEVETPVLQPLYGGAFARPFMTHHNTLDMELYLRIADELYLKRLIVGGFEGVFEISKDFRNEGMDRDHNPEFTMMELYVAFQDYCFMMDLVEKMFAFLCREVYGKTKIGFQGLELEMAPPWKRMSYFDAIKIHTGHDLYMQDADKVKAAARALGVEFEPDAERGSLLDAIFSEIVEPKLIQPTFITDYPVEISPLAKKHRSLDELVERFEGYIAGREICNAFSELNDPMEQRERLEVQARKRARGDEEAMTIDEDYLRAMEYGMPPTAGLGVGIDRLVMLLTDAASIRDVILFPQMRTEKET